MVNVPSPETLLEKIKIAIEDNEWSIKELDDFIDEITIWRDEW